jgi:hypothetical protein
MVSAEELLRTTDALSALKTLLRTDLCNKSFIPEECTPDEVVESIMTNLSEWTHDFVSEIKFKGN